MQKVTDLAVVSKCYFGPLPLGGKGSYDITTVRPSSQSVTQLIS